MAIGGGDQVQMALWLVWSGGSWSGGWIRWLILGWGGGQVKWLVFEDNKGQRTDMVAKITVPFDDVMNNETSFQRKQRGWGEILDLYL